jgi:hypothetical protein
MNYIHILQRGNAEKDAMIDALQDGLTDLFNYVLSGKFDLDPYVHKSDIMLRIGEIRHHALDMAIQTRENWSPDAKTP